MNTPYTSIFPDLRSKHTTDEFSKTERPLFPTSPIEIFFTTILCAISIVVLTYAVIVLYRCICSRNYAEWRTSWSSTKGEENSEVPVLLEVVPAVLEGHKQDIECIATDGVSFASCCVSGQLKVWDCTSGELLATIDRKTYVFLLFFKYVLKRGLLRIRKSFFCDGQIFAIS